MQAMLMRDYPFVSVLWADGGGAGKTGGLLLHAANRALEFPGHESLLLCRTLTDLTVPGGIIDLSRQWLGGRADAMFAAHDRHWSFANGSTIRFGAMPAAADVEKYRGVGYQFIGFDEINDFEEDQFSFMFSRLRRHPGQNVPLEVKATCHLDNTPGWAYHRFDMRISGGYRSNPLIDWAEYERITSKLPEVEQRRLREGW